MSFYDDDSIVMGIVTHNGRTLCNECCRYFRIGDTIYTDVSQIDYDICEKCYFGDLLR